MERGVEPRRRLEPSFPGHALYNHREWTALSRWPIFGTPGTTFGAHAPLLHERALLGHLGVMSVASLP